MKGKLISFEGIECCGKGTQAKLLFDYLREIGQPLQLMHEPGGTPYGEALRAILKYPNAALSAIYAKLAGHSDFPGFEEFSAMIESGNFDAKRSAECELFLFEASRSEYAKAIRAKLENGEHVISDRLHDSTTAYQGGGRGISMADIDAMNKIALGGLWPDLTILLDIPIEVMIERVSRENDEKNAYFEKTCDRAFFERVRTAYLAIAGCERNRFVVIDGDQPISIISDQIRAYVDELLDINV